MKSLKISWKMKKFLCSLKLEWLFCLLACKNDNDDCYFYVIDACFASKSVWAQYCKLFTKPKTKKSFESKFIPKYKKKKYKQQRYIIFGIDTTVCFVPKTDYMHMTKRNQLAAELTGQIDHWLIDGARIDRTKLARHDGFMLSVFNIISTMMFINLKIIIMNMKYTTINKLRLRKSTNCQKNSGFKAKVMRLNSFSSFFFTGRTHAVLVSHMLSKILSVSRVY